MSRRFVSPVGRYSNQFAKPFGVGPFTSTALNDGHSMWRTYLELGNESSMNPRPWFTWEVAPRERPRIAEIT